ncbi:ABC transporter ATP-binding protein [bacterium]|nr:ABC transporter ATP-binding protein [bacterium]
MIKLDTVNLHLNQKHILKDIQLDIDPSDFLSIIGPSGAGKSTLLNMLIGGVKPSSGDVYVNNVNIKYLKPNAMQVYRRRIGMVWQHFHLLPGQSVYENIAFAAQIFAHSKVKQRNMVLTALEKVNLGSKANHKIHMLSGGERQRCAIARAIVNNPYLLIADEPTGNLDPQSSNDILELLKDINAQGMTVVLVTHDKQLVDSLNRRVVLMQSGCITRDLANSSYICA